MGKTAVYNGRMHNIYFQLKILTPFYKVLSELHDKQ